MASPATQSALPAAGAGAAASAAAEVGSFFNGQAAAYAAFRPSYPQHLFEMIYSFAKLPQRKLAVDVGCGSGQVAVALAQDFEQVVALDASSEQLRHAAQRPNIEYRLSPAEATALPDRSVDLITAATCLHWFDIPAFYNEARRILRPSGALAAFAYMPYGITFSHCAVAGETLMRLYQKVTPYFHPKIHHFNQYHYEGREPTSGDFKEVKTVGTKMEIDLTVEQLVGWVQSWSCWGGYVAAKGEASKQGLLAVLQQELVEELGVPNAQTPSHMVWPITLVLARKPVVEAAAGQKSG